VGGARSLVHEGYCHKKREIGMRDKNRERCTQREIEKQRKRDERE
jgi:hypothetical protein